MNSLSIHELFSCRTKRIRSVLEGCLAGKAAELMAARGNSIDVFGRLHRFVLSGKMLRGNLVLLAADLADTELPDYPFEVAAILELVHSSILIHDDIIDRDDLRRGEQTLHRQYESWAHAQGCDGQSPHAGAAFATCTGDLGFFLAFGLLGESCLPDDLRLALLRFWPDEFARVALAEMTDIHLGLLSAIPSPEQVLAMYRHKTARYTFSLPLVTGLRIVRANDKAIAAMDGIGERLGLLFQLKDDELGLFGNEHDLGKPVGSDLRENKKTLYHCLAARHPDPALRSVVQSMTAHPRPSSCNLSSFRELMTESGVRGQVSRLMDSLADETRSMLSAAGLPAAGLDLMLQLVRYNRERRR